MKTHLIVILGILICSSLNGQTSEKLLILKDSMNNALIGATIIYSDSNGNDIITSRSDLDGRVFLRKEYKRFSVWLIGFQKTTLNSNDLKNDTNELVLKSVRYDCPDLEIKKDGTFIIDSTDYIDKFVDKEIYYEDNCPVDTIKNNDGSITIEAEICDTIRIQIDCKTATPKIGFIHYYERIAETISRLRDGNCFDSRLLVVYFSVNRLGEMKISNLIGVKKDFNEMFANKIMDSWTPAKMWGRSIKTDYRMRIKIE